MVVLSDVFVLLRLQLYYPEHYKVQHSYEHHNNPQLSIRVFVTPCSKSSPFDLLSPFEYKSGAGTALLS